MYKTVLLCYDATWEGRAALREGADIAGALGAKTHLLAIMKQLQPGLPEAVNESSISFQQQAAKDLLADGVKRLGERGIEAAGHFALGNPVDEIANVAHAIKADLIVVGHRSRSALARWWAGPEEASLLDRVHCSILVAVPSDAEKIP